MSEAQLEGACDVRGARCTPAFDYQCAPATSLEREDVNLLLFPVIQSFQGSQHRLRLTWASDSQGYHTSHLVCQCRSLFPFCPEWPLHPSSLCLLFVSPWLDEAGVVPPATHFPSSRLYLLDIFLSQRIRTGCQQGQTRLIGLCLCDIANAGDGFYG